MPPPVHVDYPESVDVLAEIGDRPLIGLRFGDDHIYAFPPAYAAEVANNILAVTVELT